MISSVHAMGAENLLSSKGLYIYSFREVSHFFQNVGYQDLWYNDMPMSRNSDGSALRFLNEKKRKILVATCDGSLVVVDSPGYRAWLDDANQAVAWFDEQSRVHYRNGMSEKRSFSPYGGPDPSGEYFIKADDSLPASQSCCTTIYSTRRPDVPLVEADVCGATRIFYKNHRVYLTGSRFLGRDRENQEVLIFQEKKENDLEQIERMVVPEPDKSVTHFYAEDLSPWGDEMLFIDAHDFPSRSVWYSFNLANRQLKKIGKMPWAGGQAFYLQCDILKKATARVRK
jgi:hypothetical protein